MTSYDDMERVVTSLAVQNLMEQRREQLEAALAKQADDTEERLHDEALEHYLLTAEDPDEERFERLWEKEGRADALKAHEVRQQVLARKRAREGYSF